MNYQTFQPHPDLASLVKCYWTLEVPADANPSKQRIIPDGCIEMAFILGDDIKRYTSEEGFILQPRAMVLGQTIEPFYIQPTGYVYSFAARFYPYGFANFVTVPINTLADTETPLARLFGDEAAQELEQKIIGAADSYKRIEVIENFLFDRFNDQATIDQVVKTTIDALLATKGNTPIKALLQENSSKRRQLERKFAHQIGISPKQLGKVIRLQTALKMLLDRKPRKLTQVAYDSDYYDQSHFIRDFREFTGISPKDFLDDDKMALSALFYTGD